MTTSGSPTPGWYPDPHDPAQIRYWDGATWTEAVAPAHGVAQDQPASQAPTQAAGPSQGPTQAAGPFQEPTQAAGPFQGQPGYQAQPPYQGQPGYQGQPPYQGQVYQGSGLAGPAHGLGDIGGWVSSIFAAVKQCIGPMAVMMLGLPLAGWAIFIVLGWLLVSNLSFDNRTDEFVGFELGLVVAMGIAFVVMLLLTAIGWIGNDHQLYRAHAGQPESLAASLGYGVRRLPRAIGWYIVLTFLMVLVIGLLILPVVLLVLAVGEGGLALLLIIVPLTIVVSLYLYVKLAFFTTAIAVGPGGVNPISASFALSAGRFWPMTGRLLLLWVLVTAVSWISGLFTQFGFLALFASVGLESDPVTGELLIDGQPADQVDVIDFSEFVPNVALLLLVFGIYIGVQMGLRAFSAAGVTGLYLRGDGPSDLND